jgi:OmpA family
MSNVSGRRNLAAILSLLTIGGALSIGVARAAGGDVYNQDLSEQRADSIKHYLVDEFGIAGTDLVTVGYGKTKLKDPANPLSEVNRRVQVANIDNKATASK